MLLLMMVVGPFCPGGFRVGGGISDRLSFRAGSKSIHRCVIWCYRGVLLERWLTDVVIEYREKNGYTCHSMPVYSASPSGEEVIAVEHVSGLFPL